MRYKFYIWVHLWKKFMFQLEGGGGVSPAEPIGAEPMYKPMEDKGNHNDLYCPPYKTSPAIESQVTRHEAILLRFKDTS